MYAPPPRIQAELHARLNDTQHLHVTGTPEWLRWQRPGQPATSFIEGPVFDASGKLWFCDIPWGRIFTVDPQGAVVQALQYDGEPNGLAFDQDGRLLIADFRRGVLAVPPGGTEPQVLCSRAFGEGLKGVNDLIAAPDGSIYFTDQGNSGLHDLSGRLYRLHADGRLECVLDGIPSPNGLVLTPDAQTLFLAVTRDNAVWRVPLREDGGVGRVGAYIRLSGGVGPDGLAMGPGGHLAVCHLGLGAVWLFSPRGEPVLRIDAPEGALTTNAIFGGPGDTTLYFTESQTGTIYRADVSPWLGQ